MKRLLPALLPVVLVAPARASRSLSVKLDNPVYRTVVIESLQQRHVVPIFVTERPAVDSLEIKIAEKVDDKSLRCQLLIDANIAGTVVNTPATKSSSTVPREDRIKFCGEFLRATLKTALSWVL